jgi:hypothetical protein
VIKVQCVVFAACKEEVKAKKRQQRKKPKGLEKRGTNETPIVVLPGYHLETKTPLPNQKNQKSKSTNCRWHACLGIIMETRTTLPKLPKRKKGNQERRESSKHIVERNDEYDCAQSWR